MRSDLAECDGRVAHADIAETTASLVRPICSNGGKENSRRVDIPHATWRRPRMLACIETLRDDLPLRSLLTEYRHQHVQKPDAEWHDRVMALPRADADRMSKLHGYLLASGWIDTRVDLSSFTPAGEIRSSYRITREGVTALGNVERDDHSDYAD